MAGNQVTGVGFGGVPRSEAAIPVYRTMLPAALVYNGDPQGVPEANALGFGLDLWNIQAAGQRIGFLSGSLNSLAERFLGFDVSMTF
ncbi:hypothetical protein BGX20_005620 [Mortierella sp. AD010]|nr:hypothetical protein BGX20_005620 [Mortierella sp. AD010]